MLRIPVTLLAAISPLIALADKATTGLLPVPDYGGDAWNRSHLSGDWGGARSGLATDGVQINVDWTQYIQRVADGGVDRTSEYGGHLDYVLHLDLMRMGLVPGALLTIRAESRYGDSVNGTAGTILPVNTTASFPLTDELDENLTIAITELNYTQFLSEHLALFVGKLDTLDADPNEFASGRGKSQFMHANLLFNSVAALRLPYSTLGAGVLWMPVKGVTVNASLVNTKDASTSSGFDDVGDGSTFTAEAHLQYRAGGLPGGANIGGLYSFDQDFTELGERLVLQPGQGIVAPSTDHTWAIYASMWQYLFTDDCSDGLMDLANGQPDRTGVGFFARVGVADQDTNPVDWSASGGLGGRGIIPGRPNDTFGIGYYYTGLEDGRIAGSLGFEDRSRGFEAFYSVAFTPAARLSFDVQVHDSVLPRIDDSVVLGTRFNLEF